jgi:hypothetical protein
VIDTSIQTPNRRVRMALSYRRLLCNNGNPSENSVRWMRVLKANGFRGTVVSYKYLRLVCVEWDGIVPNWGSGWVHYDYELFDL